MYDTYQEAQQKLSRCIVLFHGETTYIREASEHSTGRVRLHHRFLRTNKDAANYIDEEGWDFRSLGKRLGYTNVQLTLGYDPPREYKEAVYLRRVAVRQAHNTQGLSEKNVRWNDLRGSYKLDLRPREFEWASMIDKPWFCDTLEEKYPTFDDVRDRFKSDKTLISLAFDKKFALRRHDIGPFYLEYRGQDIGYTDDFSRWKIAEEYQYLTESLDTINFKYA